AFTVELVCLLPFRQSQVRRTTDRVDADRGSAGVVLYVLQKAGEILVLAVLLDDQPMRIGVDYGDGRKVLVAVIRNLLHQETHDVERVIARHEQRMAIGGFLNDCHGSRYGATSGNILYNGRLAEFVADGLGYKTADKVGGPARGV